MPTINYAVTNTPHIQMISGLQSVHPLTTDPILIISCHCKCPPYITGPSTPHKPIIAGLQDTHHPLTAHPILVIYFYYRCPPHILLYQHPHIPMVSGLQIAHPLATHPIINIFLVILDAHHIYIYCSYQNPTHLNG